MRLQSSTEYLTIFAGILVTGLIVIFLLSNFSSFGKENIIKRSSAYWYSKKPLAILEAKVSPDSPYLKLIIKNNDIQKIEILSIDTQTFSTCRAYPTMVCDDPINITSGSTRVVNLNHLQITRQTTCVPFCHTVYVVAKNKCNSSEYGNYIEIENITIRYKKPGMDTEFIEKGEVAIEAVCTPND